MFSERRFAVEPHWLCYKEIGKIYNLRILGCPIDRSNGIYRCVKQCHKYSFLVIQRSSLTGSSPAGPSTQRHPY